MADPTKTTRSVNEGPPKLTNPQIALLRETLFGPCTIHSDYKPGKRLEMLGLVSVIEGKYGGNRLTITDAGKAALS